VTQPGWRSLSEHSPTGEGRLVRRILIGGGVLVLSLVALVSTRFWLYDLYRVPSGSMVPTLQIGDLFVVSRLNKTPQRGEVVSFWYPPDPTTVFVKRTVGLPGDTVEVRDGVVSVNGEALPQDHQDMVTYLDGRCRPMQATRSLETPAGGRDYEVLRHQGIANPYRDFGPKEVEPGRYFVLGDNRDQSADSRVWGTVPADLIIGVGWKRLDPPWDRCK